MVVSTIYLVFNFCILKVDSELIEINLSNQAEICLIATFVAF